MKPVGNGMCPCAGCNVSIPARMLMCKRHWFMLRNDKRNLIWGAFEAWLEDRIKLSELRRIQREAVAEVNATIARQQQRQEAAEPLFGSVP